MAVEYHCRDANFFVHTLIRALLVLFARLMSGLTLGLMLLTLMDLEVLAKSGTPQDRKHAAKILPIVKKQHLLLCTLLKPVWLLVFWVAGCIWSCKVSGKFEMSG